MTVRGFDPDRRAQWMGNYINAIPMYYDTTLDAPPDREDAVRFDFNNTVIHSKGPAAVFALDSVLGREIFLRVYKRCLRDFGGKRLGWRDFRAVAEAESGQNLAWFFDAWVRSNQYLCYGIESKETRPDGSGGFTTEVRVKRLGTMSMPVPVRAVFEDGSAQTGRTDRTKRRDDAHVQEPVAAAGCRARSREEAGADRRAPAEDLERPRRRNSRSAGSERDAPDIYAAVKGEPIAAAEIWYRLGLDLYGANRFDDASDCFARIGASSPTPCGNSGPRAGSASSRTSGDAGRPRSPTTKPRWRSIPAGRCATINSGSRSTGRGSKNG